MKDSKDIAPIKATTAVLFAFLLVAVGGTTTTISTEVSAQTTTDNRTFESQEYGFRLQIPQGWVIQDDVMPSPKY